MSESYTGANDSGETYIEIHSLSRHLSLRFSVPGVIENVREVVWRAMQMKEREQDRSLPLGYIMKLMQPYKCTSPTLPTQSLISPTSNDRVARSV